MRPLDTINFNLILPPATWKICKDLIVLLIGFERLIDSEKLTKPDFCTILNSLRKFKKPEHIRVFSNSNCFLFVIDYITQACRSVRSDSPYGLDFQRKLGPGPGIKIGLGPSKPEPIAALIPPNELASQSSVTPARPLDAYHTDQNLDQSISLLANALVSPDAHAIIKNQLESYQKTQFLDAIYKILTKGSTMNMQHRAVRFLANLAHTEDFINLYDDRKLSGILEKLCQEIHLPKGQGQSQTLAQATTCDQSTPIVSRCRPIDRNTPIQLSCTNQIPATPIPTIPFDKNSAEYTADIIRCIRQLSLIKKIRIIVVQCYSDTVVQKVIKVVICQKSVNDRLYKESLRCLQLFSKTATKTFVMVLLDHKDLLQEFVNEFNRNNDIGSGLIWGIFWVQKSLNISTRRQWCNG